MNTVLRSFFCACALSAAAAGLQAHAAGSVEVQWLKPADYSDAGRSNVEREQVMRSLGEHLKALGKQLPDGQVLRIEITDLDLAGEVQPFGWHDLRVLRGRADWPRMSLRYTLTADSRTLKSGDARLHDMGYLFSSSLGKHQGDLGHEKRMLDQWFKTEFGTRP